VIGMGSLMLLKRIGPDAALPAERRYLPDLNLSKTATRLTLKAPGTRPRSARTSATPSSSGTAKRAVPGAGSSWCR
jgi:hypothetical protein